MEAGTAPRRYASVLYQIEPLKLTFRRFWWLKKSGQAHMSPLR